MAADTQCVGWRWVCFSNSKAGPGWLQLSHSDCCWYEGRHASAAGACLAFDVQLYAKTPAQLPAVHETPHKTPGCCWCQNTKPTAPLCDANTPHSCIHSGRVHVRAHTLTHVSLWWCSCSCSCPCSCSCSHSHTHVIHGVQKLAGALWPKHMHRDVCLLVPLLPRSPNHTQHTRQAQQGVR